MRAVSLIDSRHAPPLSLETEKSTGPIRRWLQYAFYDWPREMPRSKRVITLAGMLIQGYAIWAGFSRSLIWPLMWPQHGILLYVSLLYAVGYGVMNAMLASEFIRKTQMEADQIAARQIQNTLHPAKLEVPTGYRMEVFYQPYRAVGGDYFDVIDLPGIGMLFAVADVSGKGMPAALLAANIRALVRTLVAVDPDPLALATQINQHLSRYTPVIGSRRRSSSCCAAIREN